MVLPTPMSCHDSEFRRANVCQSRVLHSTATIRPGSLRRLSANDALHSLFATSDPTADTTGERVPPVPDSRLEDAHGASVFATYPQMTSGYPQLRQMTLIVSESSYAMARSGMANRRHKRVRGNARSHRSIFGEDSFRMRRCRGYQATDGGQPAFGQINVL